MDKNMVKADLLIDMTPDKELPLRILKSYRAHGEFRFSSSTNAGVDETSPFINAMNEAQEKRNQILDEAIKRMAQDIPRSQYDRMHTHLQGQINDLTEALEQIGIRQSEDSQMNGWFTPSQDGLKYVDTLEEAIKVYRKMVEDEWSDMDIKQAFLDGTLSKELGIETSEQYLNSLLKGNLPFLQG